MVEQTWMALEIEAKGVRALRMEDDDAVQRKEVDLRIRTRPE